MLPQLGIWKPLSCERDETDSLDKLCWGTAWTLDNPWCPTHPMGQMEDMDSLDKCGLDGDTTDFS